MVKTRKESNTKKIINNEIVHIIAYILIIIISILFIYIYYRKWIVYFTIMIAIAFFATFFIYLFKKQ